MSKSNYKPIGKYIREVSVRNNDLRTTNLLGINIDKYFMPSVANIVGTDLSVYKIVKKWQFACNRMHVGRDGRLPIALSTYDDEFIVSPAYNVFEIIDDSILSPEYLMMWFTRSEFDRNACFYTDADVRAGLSWDAFSGMKLPVPHIDKQREIVQEYKAITDRIELNKKLCLKLEETAQAIYREWFVDFECEKTALLQEYIETNPNLVLKNGTLASYIEMSNISEASMWINGKILREYQGGAKFQNNDTLLARITPCLENGKTAFVNNLDKNEIAAGSTEFIVMRAKRNVSPYFVYCLAKDERFRAYAISSMVGSSGRQRVHEKYLEVFQLPKIETKIMEIFNLTAKPIFESIRIKSIENQNLNKLKELLLSKLTKIGG